MDFDFTEDQTALRDAVRRWADKDYTFDRRRAVVKAGGSSREVWAELAGLGVTALVVPEAQGGLGMGAVEAMVVMEELGRAIVCEPYAAICLMAPAVLAQASPSPAVARWQQGIADGSERVALALQERPARYHLDKVATTAARAGADWVITGSKSLVPAGTELGAYIVPATVAGEGIGLYLVQSHQAGVKSRGYSLQDGSAAAELQFDAASASELIPAGQGLAVLELAQDVGIAALCAEAVGAMEKLVELTAEYMNTRKQFGVAIASFQALRHRLADMKMQLELARSMSYYATLKLGEPAPQRRRALSQAKVQLGQSLRFVGQQAVQLHGGIGMTDEYVGAHYFKRLTCIELSLGDTLHHLGIVSSGMQDTAGVFA
ncbi:MAG: acyl-CoA dehydrogenase family protein [Burkholderiales bacterium]|nr:acyl-CoA dehydrogenase family protein [Burkholderiales bacterium]